jgi:hypothetical protein
MKYSTGATAPALNVERNFISKLNWIEVAPVVHYLTTVADITFVRDVTADLVSELGNITRPSAVRAAAGSYWGTDVLIHSNSTASSYFCSTHR